MSELAHKNQVQHNNSFDYRQVDSFANRYLQTYCLDLGQDEEEIAKFLVREYKKIKDFPTYLDLGCGPTIHHILPATPYVRSFDLADYLQENLDQIYSWKKGDLQAHNWNNFTNRILELENSIVDERSIANREEVLRSKISNLSLCNVLLPNPIQKEEKYGAMGFFFCAEEVALNIETWNRVMANATSLIAPKGRFFCTALRKTNGYMIVKNDGSPSFLPTANISESDFEKVLPLLGFDMQETILEVIETPKQTEYGINSILLVSAKKF